MRNLGSMLTGVGVLLICLCGLAQAREEGVWTYCAKPGEVVVSSEGEDYLRLGNLAWGPNWAWTGFDGSTRTEQGAGVGRAQAKLGGTGVPLRMEFRAEHPSPRRLVLNYAASVQTDSDLTLVGVELAFGRIFDGRSVSVESGGKRTNVRLPLDKRGLGKSVQAVQASDSAGRLTTIRFDPPCDIASDGSARILLAQDHLRANDIRRVAITIDLPMETQFAPTIADLPQESGIEKWYPWQATGDYRGGVLDMSDWFSGPAGSKGRIVRKDDVLLYDGKPTKLWGLNLCYGNCSPEKALADRRADFYRSHGINAVRLHKFADGPGWSGIQSKESCIEFDPASLDRMDYQVARFKQAGIYVKLSAHFGSQKLGPADRQYVPWMHELGSLRNGRVATPHSAIHYSPELQRVQILQMVNLLKHTNPYTKMTYADDPAIAFIEIINEQSIMFYTSMAPLKASATLRKQVGARFCSWLKQKYQSHEGLVRAWGSSTLNCFASEGFKDEHLDKLNILPLGNPWYWDPAQLNGSQASKKQRLLDSLQFLYQLQCEFYQGYVKALREAGYQGEILSSNWQAGRAFSHFANLHSDWLVGTIDRHNYFGGNRANASMLSRAGSGMLSSGMQQAIDRPFMLSEWIHVFPNEMGVEGPAVLSAYGMGLQGWDVSFMFQNGDNGSYSQKIGRDQWDVTAPQIMGIFPAVSRQVHRGDVKQSAVTAVRNVHAPSLFEGKLSFDDRVIQGYDDKELDSSSVPAAALAAVRSVIAFTDQYAETPAFDLKKYIQDGAIISSTGQLRWQEAQGNSGGFFTMDTPGTKAVVGFSSGRKFVLGEAAIEPQSRFSAIYVTARGKDEAIASSREILIVAMARARNTNMRFSPGGDRMLARGDGPILMEPVVARISLSRARSPRVVALDQDGKLTDRQIPIENGLFSIDTGRDRTPYYLVRFD